MHLIDDCLGHLAPGRDRSEIERARLEPVRVDEIAPRRAALLDPVRERGIATEMGEERGFVDEDEPA